MRDALPTLKDLPALTTFYALVALLWFAVFHNAAYRESVNSAAFWQLVCAGLVCFLAATGVAFWQSLREDA